jgi:hypothetical protein
MKESGNHENKYREYITTSEVHDLNIIKIDQQTLNLLHKAFEIVLNENKIPFNKIGIAEEDDQLLFLYEGKDEKVHVFKWSKSSSIGASIGAIAQSVLMPIIPHLRLLS